MYLKHNKENSANQKNQYYLDNHGEIMNKNHKLKQILTKKEFI